MMAGAYGWIETCSTEAAKRTISSDDQEANVSTDTTCGRADVTVPVLSRSTTETRANASRGPPPLTMTPCFAALETPAMIAAGAARMSGQGVATTKTASARIGLPSITQAKADSASVNAKKPSA